MLFAEKTDKIADILKTHIQSDLGDGEFCGQKQNLGIFQLQLVTVCPDRHARTLLEKMTDVGFTSIEIGAELAERDSAMVFL